MVKPIDSKENWKDIPDYEGHYQASDLGRIRSYDRKHKGRIIKPWISKGYEMVSLSKNGKVRKFTVHRLVLKTFVCDDKRMIDHINSVRSDNRLINLQYITNQQNVLKGNSIKKKRLNCHSKFVGVYKDKNKWNSSIKVNGHNFNLGNFEHEYSALIAYEFASYILRMDIMEGVKV